MNASSTPARQRPQPGFELLPATSRHSYAGLDSPFLHKSGESGIGSSSVLPTAPSSPNSDFIPLCEAEIGEISDKDGSNFAPVDVDMDAMDDEGAEDLFFSSSSFVHSRDTGAVPVLGGTTLILCPLSQSK